jgi:hypothetical protein
MGETPTLGQKILLLSSSPPSKPNVPEDMTMDSKVCVHPSSYREQSREVDTVNRRPFTKKINNPSIERGKVYTSLYFSLSLFLSRSS